MFLNVSGIIGIFILIFLLFMVLVGISVLLFFLLRSKKKEVNEIDKMEIEDL